ncbi:MAG: hypothetical protein ACREA2_22100, partial [Blastocatellia bacterium]
MSWIIKRDPFSELRNIQEDFGKFHLPDNTSAHEPPKRKMQERKIRTELESYFRLFGNVRKMPQYIAVIESRPSPESPKWIFHS